MSAKASVTEETSGVHLWLVLMKTFQAFERHAERSIEGSGLCFSDFAILEILLHKGPLAIHQIGEKLPLTSGSLTTAVDRLEKKGYVLRQSIPEDRRTKVIHLTPVGQAVIEEVFQQHAGALEYAFSEVSQADRQTLLALLKQAGLSAKKLF